MELRDGLVRRVPAPRCSDPAGVSYTPDQIRQLYGFPEGLLGEGTLVALFENGSGWNQADLDAFCDKYGLPRFTPTVLSVDGGTNDGGKSAVDMEATLDLEWVHARAPGAEIVVVYLPPSPTWEGFGQSLNDGMAAVQSYSRHFDAVGISYGCAEAYLPPALMEQVSARMKSLRQAGTEVFVAAGDWGDYGTPVPGQAPIARPDFPASCPDVVSVGGTKVPSLSPLREEVWDNSGWGATGGGYSTVFPRPDYQTDVHDHPMRGFPDVAALADPFTGYQVIFEGQDQVIGGTSVACPVHVALYACIAAEVRRQGHTMPDYHQVVYAHPHAFRDIVGGTNSFMGSAGYPCVAGWDACTGWGAPKGESLLAACLPAPQVATAAPRVMVGVDSVSTVTADILHQVQSFLGLRPASWGRYLAVDKVTQNELGFLFSWGIGVHLIWNGQTAETVATQAQGEAAAAAAIAEAKSLGTPAGVTLTVDIEGSFPVESPFLNGWADGLHRGGFLPGAYLSPLNTTHMQALAGMDPSLRARLSVYAAHWLTTGEYTARHREWIFWERISTPPWPKDLPAGTGMWQFAGNQLGDLIDLNLQDVTASPGIHLWLP